MAQKKITDLQLRDNVEGTLNFPSDDTIQSYRVTASQIRDYVLGTEKLRLIGIQVFKASGTYTPSTGTTHNRVIAWAGGGGGGTTNSANIGGAGGGGAMVDSGIFENALSQTVTIGAGGTGGLMNNGTLGTDGGNTSFGSFVVAAGGKRANSSGAVGGLGGAIADCTVPSGGFAMPGTQGESFVSSTIATKGGSSFGNLPFNGNTIRAGVANSGQGGGGGNSTNNGAAGAEGLMLVEEYGI